MILIKPHHFMDMIKLHGAGLEVFVPDEKMGHDFYRIGNAILENHQTECRLTVAGDDVCKPCRFYQGRCTDALTGIVGFAGKDDYNRTLDTRLLAEYHLTTDHTYTAEELCRIFLQDEQKIFAVWQEEPDELTERRHRLFCAGARRYLGLDEA